MARHNPEEEMLWGYRMEGIDWLLYPVGLLWFVGSIGADQPLHTVAATVFVGLLRIRIILRNTRLDGLRRDLKRDAK